MDHSKMKAHVCPYLGLKDDSDTALAYPSPANYCFRTTPVIAIKLDHQREFCLSGKQRLCALFQGEPVPSRARVREVSRRSKRLRHWIRNLLVTLFPTLLVLAGIVAFVLLKPGPAPTSPPFTFTEIPPTLLVERSRTPLIYTPIPSPSITLVETAPPLMVVHALEVPIGSQPSLVIHQVSPGESLASMAQNYGTTEAAITSINYGLSLPLWPNAVIVIPLNLSDVSGLPQFEPYHLTEDLSLQALADRFSTDIELLRVYNLVNLDQVFTAGEWVLIPHPRLATPTG
jgi:hypothetical protein